MAFNQLIFPSNNMTQGRIYNSEIGKGGFNIKAFCQQGAKSFTSHHSKKTRKKRCPLYSSLFAHPPGRRPRKTICGANEVSWPSASVSIFHCNTPRGQSFSFQAKLDFPLSYPKGHHLLAPSGALIAIPDLLLTHHPTFFQITPVLKNNIELSLSEPLQLYQKQSLDSSAGYMYTLCAR